MKPVCLDELKTRMLCDDESVQAYHEADQEILLIQALYEMRERAGLTQMELANKLGTNALGISRLEKKPLSASVKMLKRYASACGAKISLNIHYL
ncbi:XRE family transcriptional regulator [Buttiauxella warmboldiae]|uniref:XRE family transcriptional regulator n=1 Tax=Buttiauxella warmboldiae TaxID=82993 RepID=A0A3N5E1N9_9ENTR|nr:helix-turn-helix transcriptional regulator [Buttiauxella warmboldiae]RPH28839.1 XRE family transcriptional regulator [Buttiauxella warmboldiae]